MGVAFKDVNRNKEKKKEDKKRRRNEGKQIKRNNEQFIEVCSDFV